jgi:RIO-like serine/threonine protein kinase
MASKLEQQLVDFSTKPCSGSSHVLQATGLVVRHYSDVLHALTDTAVMILSLLALNARQMVHELKSRLGMEKQSQIIVNG